MARPHIRRFHPTAFTPAQAYARATETPREVRHLGEAALEWTLGNIKRDATSDVVTPNEFGVEASIDGANAGTVTMRVSDQMRLAASSSALTCDGGGTLTVLTVARFEPMRQERDAPRPRRCVAPLDWILGWSQVGAALRRLAEYERWLQRRGPKLRSEVQPPKAARKLSLLTEDLPDILAALAQWADDSEQAMLAWVIADAKFRGVEPELPAEYRPPARGGWLSRVGRGTKL